MPLKHRELCDLILYELYWLAAEPNGPEDVAPNDLSVALEGRSSGRFFDIAISTLLERGLIEAVGRLPDTVAITQKGILHIETELDNPNSFLFGEDLGRSPDSKLQIPASDRLVELDHNNPNYVNAMTAGQNLIAAVKNSNWSVGDDNDKERRLCELEAGYKLLEARRVNRTTVKVILGSTLAYLITKFADEPIGDLAKAAWSALKVLIGL